MRVTETSRQDAELDAAPARPVKSAGLFQHRPAQAKRAAFASLRAAEAEETLQDPARHTARARRILALARTAEEAEELVAAPPARRARPSLFRG
ncbi:hypothetical protein [Solirhodobacter olei]|uniref:hypothetical protein n=1 Tax=Solirhodobacter olei TaxID=2493082 RepID=UPI000FD81BE2|nr:hypothetical protein [Solirhodobacter olei]